ncbi:2-oxoglutarate dehydrogenase, E1 subunit [Geobacter metallireducens RCH3]|uniref:2-oxoglutarate dehydrogenase E1 component n=1 Tax=Geobacter metallireducens (strain ATCC 53774 / DSM 7210 / GS-15) TaxID=269799 RepID=Q39RY7_GEOMG|nr:2-oxoglutarate dehydrogenase E1 component [Geobacter metallireducens]ABB32987.1 2-oxoglutarate dehydrogenase, E1 protein [Geobacter metallireducens GS-15]EHP88879.1 2-oxoglutarate dehydrogenase, E1 subunit [Geobacter metallireducens RCH3]
MTILPGADPEFIESLYLRWRDDPAAVSTQWHAFFSGYELGRGIPGAEALPPKLAAKQSAVDSLIYRYRDLGHLLACTDPLSPCKLEHPLLALDRYDLGEVDLDRTFHPRRFLKREATLREILATLRETYCRSVGVEFMHIQDPAVRSWLMERMEPVRNRPAFSREEKLRILGTLQEAALFEEFLHRKFLGQKRFSLEGGETLIPLLDAAVERAAEHGVTDLILGMAHRGRLNVLANIFGKPLENIFAEFADNAELGIVGDGDVKYHKGFSHDREVAPGRSIHLAMAFNPSHLEAVDPVVEGKCRARQDSAGAGSDKRVLPVLIHGDASFAGQGVVAETLNLSQLEGYRTGGTLHIVINNQIGFTTLPADARSSLYATDVAKMVAAPVFHVHGEDPEAAVHVVRLALDYRQAFGGDVVVEIICYRRHGHNEGDEPYFTQPAMYSLIKDRPPVHELYAARLAEEGIGREEIDARATAMGRRLDAALAAPPAPVHGGFEGKWERYRRDYAPVSVETGVSPDILRNLAGRLAAIPDGFTPHPKVAALLNRRREAVEGGEGIDWGNAETLAYATLLADGVSIRLSGEDSRRGTFGHRHSFLYDMATDAHHVPLAGVAAEGAAFHGWDSMLSEFAVLGFEYGYSVEAPESLVIWEAQFGDFANGGQVIIDQFMAGGESKWQRVSGLVLLLPHGFEGQGAEHSSARIERYLQLCGDNNMQVAYPSTPGQLFHLLRRQMKHPFRKPLVVFTPKSLLRHPRCVSRLEELAEGGFREVIATGAGPDKASRLILCTGKIFYDLLERLEQEKREDVAIVRVEQLYPLRSDFLGGALEPYRGVADVAWVQEEPRNMGAWSFIRPHLAELLGTEPRYVGRPENDVPAVGSHRLHGEEQGRIVEDALGAGP